MRRARRLPSEILAEIAIESRLDAGSCFLALVSTIDDLERLGVIDQAIVDAIVDRFDDFDDNDDDDEEESADE